VTSEELRGLAQCIEDGSIGKGGRIAIAHRLRIYADALDAGPVAWMYPDDYERMVSGETFCTVFSVKVGSPTQGTTTVQLYPHCIPPAPQPVSHADELGPVAVRYGWDGHGYQYADNGTGSDWLTRHGDAEALYLHPPTLRLPEPMGYAAGIEAVAAMIEAKAQSFAGQHGSDDMGSLSFGSGDHAEAKSDYYNSLVELAEEVRAMLDAAPTPFVAEKAPYSAIVGDGGMDPRNALDEYRHASDHCLGAAEQGKADQELLEKLRRPALRLPEPMTDGEMLDVLIEASNEMAVNAGHDPESLKLDHGAIRDGLVVGRAIESAILRRVKEANK
jgi:hypothetical protein